MKGLIGVFVGIAFGSVLVALLESMAPPPPVVLGYRVECPRGVAAACAQCRFVPIKGER